ncbi:hypothetical protein FHS19_006997 [Paenibacillus rhizosphaerae]|uniref:Uncharacterized protein n=1 Tax=Paenibacillus rhizosphaerae TaxID=297318 RepID=A0A839U3N6_9BACL|nr:hypothetical protein [Paenibacillus rhizosphaerae]
MVENDWSVAYRRNADDQYSRIQLYKTAELLRQAYNELDAILYI